MACDFILASDDAKFGQPEINVGAIPGAGGSQRMPRFIGKSKAMYAILTGDMIDANEAEKCGSVAKVFSSENFNEEVLKVALTKPLKRVEWVEVDQISKKEKLKKELSTH